MTCKIIESTLDFEQTLEKISGVVFIKAVSDDISHPDGFQVSFLGASYTLEYEVNIIHLFSSDEKKYVDKLIGTIRPGSCWLVTGEHLFLTHYCKLVVFPTEYQSVDVSKHDDRIHQEHRKYYDSVTVIETFNKKKIEAFKSDLQKSIDTHGNSVSGITQTLTDMNKWFPYPEDPQASDYINIISSKLNLNIQAVIDRFSLKGSGTLLKKL